jgi:hypothetical protein
MLLLEITEAITQLSQKELEKVKYAVRKEQKKRKAQAAETEKMFNEATNTFPETLTILG